MSYTQIFATLEPSARAVAMYRAAMPAAGGGTLDDRRQGYEELLGSLAVPAKTSVSSVEVQGLTGTWVDATGGQAHATIVLLHGGGYIIGSAFGYRALGAYLSRAIGAYVFIPEYRLAPENRYPAAIEDAQAAVALARAAHPNLPLVLFGDSAGGGLALSALLAIRAAGSTMPDAVLLVSALVDLEIKGSTYDTKAEVDPIVSRNGITRAASLYLDGRDVSSAPLAFPLHSDLSGLPPTQIIVGTAEVLLDDSRVLFEAMDAAGVDVYLREWQDMVHVWPHFAEFLPEAREALMHLSAFVRSHLGTPQGSAADFDSWLNAG